MGMTTYLAKELLKHVLGIAAFSRPDVYLGVGTDSPGVSDEDSWADEISGNGYARQLIRFAAAPCENSGEVRFPRATGNWGSISHYGLWSSVSGGKLLVFGEFNEGFAQTVNSGDMLRVVSGGIEVDYSVGLGSMGWSSGYLRQKLVEHVFCKGVPDTEFALPTIYLGLADGALGAFTEPSGGNYARKQWSGSGGWNNPSVSDSHAESDTNNKIQFNTASAAWGNIQNCVLYDALTGGEWLIHGIFSTRNIVSGDAPAYNTGDLVMMLGE